LRAHVIVNRRARHLASPRAPSASRASGASKLSRQLDAELRRPRPGIEVIETSSVAELDDVARMLLARRREASPNDESEDESAVVLAGGDGSYMAGVTALARAAGSEPLPPIALAPGGTVGTVARNWGMTTNPVQYTARLLDAIANGAASTTLRPSLRVRERGGAERVGFIFGAGLVARFFELY
jgi:diacylglycerol kinase (ATP)